MSKGYHFCRGCGAKVYNNFICKHCLLFEGKTVYLCGNCEHADKPITIQRGDTDDRIICTHLPTFFVDMFRKKKKV